MIDIEILSIEENVTVQLEKLISTNGELVLQPGDVNGEYCFIITLSHELFGSTDFGLSMLEELRDLVDQKIKILRGEIPDTDALAASADDDISGWWTGAKA